MSNPQQPELARSRKTPAQDADAVAGVLDGQRDIGADAPRGPVPPENQPGHHPADEQDQPDVDKFAAKLGTMEPAQREAVLESEQPAQARAFPDPARIAALAVGALTVVLAVVLRRRRRSRRSRR